MYVAAWQDNWFIQIDNVHLFSEQTRQDGFAWKDTVTHNVTNTKILSDLHHYSLLWKKTLVLRQALNIDVPLSFITICYKIWYEKGQKH